MPLPALTPAKVDAIIKYLIEMLEKWYLKLVVLSHHRETSSARNIFRGLESGAEAPLVAAVPSESNLY